MSYQHRSATRVEENDTFKPTTLGPESSCLDTQVLQYFTWQNGGLEIRCNTICRIHIEIIFAQKKCSFGKLKPNYYIINKHYIYNYIYTWFCDNSMLTEMQSFPKPSSHVSRCAALPWLPSFPVREITASCCCHRRNTYINTKSPPCGAWMERLFSKKGLHWRWNSSTMHFC